MPALRSSCLRIASLYPERPFMINRGWRRFLCLVPAWILAGGLSPVPAVAEPPLPPVVDFNRDIRPIFSENCYQCHGPDKNKRKADLRLDTREGLFATSGETSNVAPGKPDQSQVYRLITTKNAMERMPDPKSGKMLNERQISLIKRWIEQGAQWKGHWAYLKPVRPEVPIPTPAPGGDQGEGEFVKNPIDRFILAKLREVNLRPSPEADHVTLIRRLYFDLTGLPPTWAEVEAFVNDRGSDAYEKVVDHLLASPHYGERMAMYWLDLVRYADSVGYQSDNSMAVSPYRDYVIASFNRNQPFDQFTVEQLAGDLMPEASMSQKVASAYNRLLQTTAEGGAQPREYEAKYAADRVRNVSTVWMGATMGCCQCHNHKFDPYTMKDFYSLAAFFADVQEWAVGPREAGMPVPEEAQAAELKQIEDQIAAVKKNLEAPPLAAAQEQWEKNLGTPATLTDLDVQGLTTAAGHLVKTRPRHNWFVHSLALGLLALLPVLALLAAISLRGAASPLNARVACKPWPACSRGGLVDGSCRWRVCSGGWPWLSSALPDRTGAGSASS